MKHWPSKNVSKIFDHRQSLPNTVCWITLDSNVNWHFNAELTTPNSKRQTQKQNQNQITDILHLNVYYNWFTINCNKSKRANSKIRKYNLDYWHTATFKGGFIFTPVFLNWNYFFSSNDWQVGMKLKRKVQKLVSN